jgi:hypothetical protein
MKSEATGPVQAIFDVKEIGSFKTFPAVKETTRSFVSPTNVVNFFQSAFTSVLIKLAILFASPAGAGAPAHVTSTTSITRSSTA